MGVTIESYRQRIGCFYQTGVKISSKSKSRVRDNKAKCSKTKTINFISLFIRSILLLTLCGQCCAQLSPIRSPLSSRTSLAELNLRICNNYPSDVNFLARYKFGNKKKNGIKIMHWNAGGGFLENKIHEIENIIGGYRPHLLGISETYFKKGQDISNIEIEDYKIYFSKTLDNPRLEVSRCAVYVHKDVIKPKLRLDLMTDDFSSVWLEIHLPRQKRILVGNAYREWQYLRQNDDSSLKIEAQLERFTKCIEQWEKALGSSMECHLLGDLNLNYSTQNPKSQQTLKPTSYAL